MYELKQGAERLTAALHNRLEDERALARLAQALNYMPEQLAEDIQALYDFLLQDTEQPSQSEKVHQ